jgi:hypothetical protein
MMMNLVLLVYTVMMMRLGVKGSLANLNSMTTNARNMTDDTARESMVRVSPQYMFPPRSRPKRRKKMAKTRVITPLKSTRLRPTLKSEMGTLGKSSAIETAMIATSVAGTWIRNALPRLSVNPKSKKGRLLHYDRQPTLSARRLPSGAPNADPEANTIFKMPCFHC